MRRKNPQNLDQQKASSQKETPSDVQCGNIENDLWKEIENLKIDKNSLMQELVDLREHQETAESKLLCLRDRLQGMEKNQQQLLSFLVMAMQSPGFLVQLLKPKESNWRMAEAGNMLEQGTENDVRPVLSDGMIVRYQAPMHETSQPLRTPSSGAETMPESDSVSDEMQDFFTNSEFMKVLMDEKLCSVDSLPPFIFPDFIDDGSWEQLLLASPSLENNECTNGQGQEAVDDSGMEVELAGTPNFESLIKEMENSQSSGEGPDGRQGY